MFDRRMFGKPLSRRKHTDYNEELALLILKQCFPEQFSNLIRKDAPDLQDRDGIMGIEVVEAIEKKKAEIDGVFSNRRIDNSSISYEKCKEIIEKNGGELDEYGITYPVITNIDEKNIIQNAIRKKIKKYKEYKAKGFEELSLFVLFNEPIVPVEIHVLKRYFSEPFEDVSETYKRLFFLSVGLLFIYEIKEDKMQMIKIGREEYDDLLYQARINIE